MTLVVRGPSWPAVRRPGRLALVAVVALSLLPLLWGGSAPGLPLAGAQVVATATTKPATAGTAARSPLPPGGPKRPAPAAAASRVTARGTRAATAGPGAVLGWGLNTDGALGDGTLLSSSTAVSAQGLTGVVALGPGNLSEVGLALRRDGTVVSWGKNDEGELGDGTTNPRIVPGQVLGLPGADPVVALAAGGFHNLALTQGGAVYAWGNNSLGQVGQNTTGAAPVTSATQVKGVGGVGTLSGIVAIAAGGYHNLAVAGNGTVYAWGDSSFGQLGDTTTTPRPAPVVVSGTGVGGLNNLGNCAGAGANCAVAAGSAHSLARAADGRVFAWGSNSAFALGDGTTTPSQTAPVAVLPVSGTGQLVARSIAAGTDHSLAVANDGTALGWGFGDDGELGDGLATSRNRPAAVTVEAGGAPLTGITTVAGGFAHSLALTTGGGVMAWGGGTVAAVVNFGQVGDGTLLQRNRAVPVLNVAGVTAIAARAFSSLAIGPDFPLATVTPQPTATPASTATPQPTATVYIYTPPPTSALFYPITPVRILDTRASDPPGILHVGFDENGNVTPSTPILPGVARRFKVAGQTFAGTAFPTAVRALKLNVTALPTAGFGGFLTIYPGHLPDAQRPLTSVLNPILGINNNFFSTTLAPAGGPNAGTFAAYTQAVPLDLVIDVVGYFQ